jgi:hypothetical protein
LDYHLKSLHHQQKRVSRISEAIKSKKTRRVKKREKCTKRICAFVSTGSIIGSWVILLKPRPVPPELCK